MAGSLKARSSSWLALVEVSR